MGAAREPAAAAAPRLPSPACLPVQSVAAVHAGCGPNAPLVNSRHRMPCLMFFFLMLCHLLVDGRLGDVPETTGVGDVSCEWYPSTLRLCKNPAGLPTAPVCPIVCDWS